MIAINKEELKITKEDLALWLDRPPSNDDLDLCAYLEKALENQHNYYQENKQLKDNWNYIKKMLKEVRQEKFNVNGYCGTCTDVDIDFLLNKMQELEQGSDSNGNN